MNFEKYRENNIDLSDTRKKKAKIDFKRKQWKKLRGI